MLAGVGLGTPPASASAWGGWWWAGGVWVRRGGRATPPRHPARRYRWLAPLTDLCRSDILSPANRLADQVEGTDADIHLLAKLDGPRSQKCERREQAIS